MRQETNPVNITQELDQNTTLLLLMPGAKYNDVVIDTARKISGKRVCYITLNKTFRSLEQLFSAKGIDTHNFFYVDAISTSFKNDADETEKCEFVNSGSLGDLLNTLTDVLDSGFDYVIFDNITNLTVYEKHLNVTKFLGDVLHEIKKQGAKAILYAVEEYEAQANKYGTIVDATIRIPDEKQ